MIRSISERERKQLKKNFDKLQKKYDKVPEEAILIRKRIMKKAESIMRRIEE